MSYDFDDLEDHSPPKVADIKYEPHDLEAIVLYLTLAAIELSPAAGSKFTYDQLLSTAREIAQGEFEIEDVDAKIVLSTSKIIRKEKAGFYSLA